MLSTSRKVDSKIAVSIFNDYLAAQRGKIPWLPDFANVSDRVVRILGGNPGQMQLQGTNTYLVGTGRKRLLIDTGQGYKSWINTLSKYLDEHDLEISLVLLTHWHTDHTGGIRDLMKHFPTLRGRIFKCNPDRGQQGIVDGQNFEVEGATISAIFSPGHATDHMCFMLREEHSLFTGDNVLGHGYTVIEDLGTYLHSLQLMASQQCLTGYPGHGAKIEDLPSRLKLYERREDLRLRQVYTTLCERQLSVAVDSRRKSGFTSRELVTALYGDVSDALFELALEPCINLCLWKLAEDGMAAFHMNSSSRQWYSRNSVT